ncbi:MAG: Asp-tRNA(Asn)/Glu-tRNA(Gln) amidotransferase GatCAB subunit A, partial [Planctomycetes bacterium]|nr:Asp-tRNA(Asn)/Glu-tRNA(Gln) amidotransferase GatCAB subunit A [Planctomycetota bacterium]
SAPRAPEAMPAGDALRGTRIGYVPEHAEGLQPAVRAALDETKARLQAAGATLVPVRLPHERFAVAVYYVIGTGEASSNLSRMDGIRFGHRATDAAELRAIYGRSRAEGFGAEAKRRIMLGTYVLSTGYYDAYYKKAQQVRRLICRDYEQAFAACDAILGPASPTTAFKLGEKLSDPLQMYLSDIFTIATNLAGVPGVSVPVAKDEAGLPIGMQLQGPMFSDARLMAIAAAVQRG